MNMNKNNQHKVLMLTPLAFSIILARTMATALVPLEDDALRKVNGQDGVHLSATLSEANVDQLYWEDEGGRGNENRTNNKLRATADHLRIRKSNVSNQPLTADVKINTGSDGQKAGLDLKASLTPTLVTMDSFRICDRESSSKCSAPIGSFALQTTSNTEFQLRTRDGLFSKDNLGEMTLGLKNANIYLGLTDVNSQLNQLILNNFNFNFTARGAFFVDPVQGLMLQTNARNGETDYKAGMTSTPNHQLGYVDLKRVANSASKNSGFINTGTYGNGKSGSEGETTNSGLNVEVMLNKNASKNDPYALNSTTHNPEGAKGLIRVGASGRMVNSSLQFRGMTGDAGVLGVVDGPAGMTTKKESVIGNSGIGFRMKAEFTKDNDSMLGSNGQATTLEIGGAGLNAYGFEFSNLTGLQPNTRASFDSGNVFINLVDSKTLKLPENYLFQKSRFGNGDFLTVVGDYTQTIHSGTTGTNPYSLVAAIRGAEFQSISRRGRFTNSAGMAEADLIKQGSMPNEWGLATPLYNLNANVALYGTEIKANEAYYYTLDNGNPIKHQVASNGETSRLGMSFALTTEGVDRDNGKNLGNKTTSILVIDGGKVGQGANATSTDYYMGLRNIDLLAKGHGHLGVENGSINMSLRDMLIVMSMEVAGGYLPGTTYKTCRLDAAAAGCSTQRAAPLDNFARPDDALFGLNLRLGGNLDLSVIPNNSLTDGGNLTLLGELDLTGDHNTIQIKDPYTQSILGLDRITGKVGFNTAIVVSKDQETGAGQVGLNAALLMNPQKTPTGVFRARDINFYPPTAGQGARLGELAITGGRISSEFRMTPRN